MAGYLSLLLLCAVQGPYGGYIDYVRQSTCSKFSVTHGGSNPPSVLTMGNRYASEHGRGSQPAPHFTLFDRPYQGLHSAGETLRYR